jgi:Ca-activated chloride channel family protein
MLTFQFIWAFCLLPLPLLVWWLVPARTVQGVAVRVSFIPRLRELSEAHRSAVPKPSRQTAKWLLRTLLWLLVVTAAARPQWLQPPVTRELPTRDLLLLVDLSGSMEHEDFTSASGQSVDRLTAVKEVLDDFLVKRKGDRVGLVVFGNAAFVQAPFTSDLELCRQLLDEAQVRMAGPRTALGDAMGLGITLFENSELPTKTMIALTDGNDTASGMPPDKAASVAKDRGITIHTVAVGDPASVGEEKIDEATLRTVSQTTGGKFFKASDRTELATIYDDLDRLETVSVETISHRPRRDLFWVPLAAALLLSLGGTLLGGVIRALRERRESSKGPAGVAGRVRVNPRTGELEATA